ncbi:MAG: TerB N-terminal domain-containing protein [Candidatus Marithrix sp.]|nr:TerB N-terminal domain-containing protein [Candidatus Marithrix sp.]
MVYTIIKGILYNKKSIEQIEPEYLEPLNESIFYPDTNEWRNGEPAKWYGKGQSVNVQGYDIADGMVYVGETLPNIDKDENDACLINPKLEISLFGPIDERMVYWPQYANISKRCRYIYLKWLASGRSDPKIDIDYIFLFFYGLERRLFVDGQQEDISEIELAEVIEEVNRLVKIYGSNNSFFQYTHNFLTISSILYKTKIPDHINFNNNLEPFKILLAQYVVAKKTIPANMALQWIDLRPEFSLKTPARRCKKEFKELFAIKYQKKFGNGLIIKPNKTPLKIEHYTANPSLKYNLKLKITELPNPFILTAPLKKINLLIEECTVELEPYSRFIGRKDNNPNSLAALALLPKELAHSDVDKVQTRLTKICAKPTKLISLKLLYEIFGNKIPTKISKKEAENFAALIEKVGFRIVPDVRLYNIKSDTDTKVIIFPQKISFKPSKEFHTISVIIRLGAMISQTDEHVSPEKEKMLQRLIRDNDKTTEIEKDNLIKFLYWCLRVPQKFIGLKQKLSTISPTETTTIRHILVSLAHANGFITPKAVKQLEKLYNILGLSKKQVISDIHTIANKVTTVSLRDHETTFPIPKPTDSADSNSFRLNEELIKVLEKETHQVKGVLEDIFSESDTIEPDTSSSNNPLTTLDKSHQKLFNQLLTQETWDKNAVHIMCKELGLMTDGAMEVLNEWAFEHVNEPIIEDGEPIYIDINLAKEITNVQST